MKNFRKFLKFKKNGKFAEKEKFPNSWKEKKDFKKKDGKDSQSSQAITCYECNGHGHHKKECSNYLRGKGNVYATTLSDIDSSNLDSDENCDGEGNFSAFITIAPVESSDDLSVLVEELGEHTELIQANAKVLAHQKPFSNKSKLGYTRESSSSVKVSKDMKFVKAKEPMVEITTVEKVRRRRSGM